MSPSHLNVAICMTQGPEAVNVAVALLLPDDVTALSSAMLPSGTVMIREVNPLPAALFNVATVFAQRSARSHSSLLPLRCSHSCCSRLLRHPSGVVTPVLQYLRIGYAALG